MHVRNIRVRNFLLRSFIFTRVIPSLFAGVYRRLSARSNQFELQKTKPAKAPVPDEVEDISIYFLPPVSAAEQRRPISCENLYLFKINELIYVDIRTSVYI